MRHKVLPLLACFLLFLGGGLFAANNALYFDGVDDCVAIGNMASKITSSFTVEAWFNPATLTTPTLGRTIFAGTSGTNKNIWVTHRGDEISVCSYKDNTPVILTTSMDLDIDEWYHIAVSVVGQNGEVKLYVDGELKGSGTAGNVSPVWGGLFTIGDLRPSSTTHFAFNGLIDEVRLWNVVRTATDINNNYDKPVSPSSANLVGYWKLDEIDGTIANDSTINGYDGRVQDGTATHTSPDWQDGVPTLPVELSSFTAILTADLFVRLQWITQSETGVSGFYIYRSTERDIATAMIVNPFISATNTSEQQSYQYVDSNLYEPGTYYYWLSVQNIDGSVDYHGPTTVYYDTNPNQGTPGIPIVSGLSSIYPNPFNPSATVAYGLSKDADVNFVIYNSRGQIIRQISEGQKAAGSWKLIWNGLDENGDTYSSGVYHIRMNAGNQSFVKKAVLMK
ncbi:MAG: T9SS type A sorting domain-containing protein [Candidatus Cloacimonetes bacterium]|nr:T9SS type A sorting domain-containing protein [Candidatus Cloacimonadota bacterium]MDY0172312.1 LamG-like jellyroll fold domain-containing protein [Candidatus Cloacimonadaceae bacterium]